MGRRQYAVHRWLGALAGVQLLLWSAGGFVFATHDIDWVRGERGRNPAAKASLALAHVRLSPAELASRLGAGAQAGAKAGANIEHLELRMLLDRPVYEIRQPGRTSLIDARTGAPRSPVDRDTALAIALADRKGSPAVMSVERIEADPPVEYRGRPLPAWQVTLADGEGTHIYVAADSGRITARRNDAWRRFDFFWMLHTMDYSGRDDFNHPLLMGFALLGLLSAGSGLVLWGARLRRHRRRRRRGRGASGVIAAG